MLRTKTLVALLGVFICGSHTLEAQQRKTLIYDIQLSTVTRLSPEAAEYVKAQIDTFNQVIGEVFQPSKSVRVAHIYCGAPGRDQFNHALRLIDLCQETLTAFDDYQNYLKRKVAFRNRMTVSALWFVLAHELSHAIIADLQIPRIGDIEVATDQLASILLLEGDEPGVGGASDLLDLFGEMEGDAALTTYHGSSVQRASRVDCLSTGAAIWNVDGLISTRRARRSDPLALAYLEQLREDILSTAPVQGRRLTECVRDYPLVFSTWTRLLGSSWRKGKT